MIAHTIGRALGAAAIALSFVAAVPQAAASPTPFSALYAFGDSLSDVGNFFTLSGGTIPDPAGYQNGQWSNGNVWLQTLAGQLNLAPLTPSLLGGTDFAYGGAQSGATLAHAANPLDVSGVTGQIAQFKAAHPVADPNALYALWIGGNDLLGINAGMTPAQLQLLAAQTVGNIETAIASLAGAGARNLLVLTLPDVGKTPGVLADGPVASGTASTIAASFNQLLLNGNAGSGIPGLSALGSTLGLNLTIFDAFGFMNDIITNPGVLGLTNVTQACLSAPATACANPDQYFFWDDTHPTAVAHAALGNAVYGALAIPEPATWAMVILAFGMVWLVSRRRVHATGDDTMQQA